MTKAERTRQFIIEKTAPIFNTKGVAGTSIRDMMESTKMAKGSLYVHFKDKEELSYAVVDYNLDRLVSKVLSAVNTKVSAKDKLFAYLDTVSIPMSPPVAGGCPMLNFGMEADDTNPFIAEKVNAVISASRQLIASIIKQGIETNELNKEWDAEEFALKLVAMTEGGILISRVAKRNEPMREVVKMLKKEIESQSY